jgi:hypothetical protein
MDRVLITDPSGAAALLGTGAAVPGAGTDAGAVGSAVAVLVAGEDAAAVGEAVAALRAVGAEAAGWVGDPSDPAVREMAAELFPGADLFPGAEHHGFPEHLGGG